MDWTRLAMRRSRVRMIFVLLAGVLLPSCRGSGSGRARVIVPRGATLRVAAESLAHSGVVQSATAFRR